MEYAGRLTVLVAVIFYIVGCPERQRQAENQRKTKHYQAWQVINSAQGKKYSGGRIDALQDLNKEEVDLIGVDIYNAFLPRGTRTSPEQTSMPRTSQKQLSEARTSQKQLSVT